MIYILFYMNLMSLLVLLFLVPNVPVEAMRVLVTCSILDACMGLQTLARHSLWKALLI
jgi:hypothetical protein